jgi:glycosyltransferase involved in cell wall biosynthesis/SAM-dependent methyltransferase
MIAAKQSDLSLPEYAAFNHGHNYPHMRRWELPFALYSLRLPNTAAVLDCTINPMDFGSRLQSLYPHAVYRHWNPIQRGQFALPLGVPDEAFDRVVCINTLEHLLAHQREALVAEMSRKLKPGGLLVLTSDFYFDSMRQDEAVLKSGFMRADGAEVFNGWNCVAPREYIALCARHGLRAWDADAEESRADAEQDEPRADDSSLYLNSPPHGHACIAGVFYKGATRPKLADARRIVLALLTWNTCDISIESVRALADEARTLRRLGHEAFVCVCDNGSTDGTPEALRELEPEMDIPHKFILNRENLGSSVARNQIIDYMTRECDAVYLLFVDGDIETVPCSSFAMLRHMENHGRLLGCVGANSWAHTPERTRVTPYLFSLYGHQIETTNLVAWTQYGLFRREVFEDGVRFDESAPFNQPGWGFEDNDLAFQMEMKGYVNHHFHGMIYLHRNVHSSLRIMRQRGIDGADAYARRKQYILDKWSRIPVINNGPLVNVRQVRMPDLTPPAQTQPKRRATRRSLSR